MLYYCVICGPIFDYVVVLYTKRKIKHQNFEIDHLDITSIHNLYEEKLNYENVQHFYVMEFGLRITEDQLLGGLHLIYKNNFLKLPQVHGSQVIKWISH